MRIFLLPVTIVGAIAWASLVYLTYTTPPEIEGKLVLSNLSYVILAVLIALTTTATLAHYFIFSLFLPKSRTVNPVLALRTLFRRSLRRGFLLSITATSLMVLNAIDILNLINATLLIGIAVLVEIYFSSR